MIRYQREYRIFLCCNAPGELDKAKMNVTALEVISCPRESSKRSYATRPKSETPSMSSSIGAFRYTASSFRYTAISTLLPGGGTVTLRESHSLYPLYHEQESFLLDSLSPTRLGLPLLSPQCSSPQQQARLWVPATSPGLKYCASRVSRRARLFPVRAGLPLRHSAVEQIALCFLDAATFVLSNTPNQSVLQHECWDNPFIHLHSARGQCWIVQASSQGTCPLVKVGRLGSTG